MPANVIPAHAGIHQSPFAPASLLPPPLRGGIQGGAAKQARRGMPEAEQGNQPPFAPASLLPPPLRGGIQGGAAKQARRGMPGADAGQPVPLREA